MRQPERLGAILELLDREHAASVAELAGRLGASAASVRRDLALLDAQQLITRTHGGATRSAVFRELPMSFRAGHHQGAKRAIAAFVVGLLPAAVESIALNGGSTTAEVARALGRFPRLRVVTNALPVAAELVARPGIDLVVCGGNARMPSQELVGPIAEAALSRINVQFAIMGVDGVSRAGGLTTHHEIEAQTNRAMADAAETVYVVADSSKLGRRGFAQILALDAIAGIVTDDGADPSQVRDLEAAGVEVHQAPSG
ncbi:MAG: DeoR/GlpR family DNA-binding transcription regulator [Actinomycetia bacterium]|nr:DeoR/GlpR family DNA-binding transcription regulator [Actinomycetes bacterium]